MEKSNKAHLGEDSGGHGQAVPRRPAIAFDLWSCMKPVHMLLIVTAMACAGYLLGFLSTGAVDRFCTFDSVIAQDTAQIARNTLDGDFLETKYILPVAYARFQNIENHPDYIRYPLPILTYALLFIVAPQHPATVKSLNGILFLLNVALVYYITLCLFRRQDHWTFPRHWIQGLAALCALSSSLLMLPYLRWALTDAYEILTVTAVLIAFVATFLRQNPVLAGASATLLYLSRPNMAVFGLLMIVFIVARSEGRNKMLRAALLFFISGFVVFLPFLVRNMVLAQEPLFYLQQSVELLKGVKGEHTELYRSFALPPSLFPMSPDEFRALTEKITHNLRLPIHFALETSYLLPWSGLVLFALFFRKERLVLITCIGFVLLHTIACSPFIQLSRVYVPVFFLPLVLGYAGVIAALPVLFRSIPNWIAAGVFVVSLILITLSPVVFRHRLPGFSDHRTHPPSSSAAGALQDRGIRCVYANNPFWITWYTDMIAVYGPVDPKEMLTKGPPECGYYMADTRYSFPVGFLRKNAQRLYEDSGCILFRLSGTADDRVQQKPEHDK